MAAVTNNRLIKSPVGWYSNPKFLRIFRVVQLLPLLTLLGLLGYVSYDGEYYATYGLIASSIATLYLILIIIVPVPANIIALIVCAFEVIMASIMLAAFVELGVDNGYDFYFSYYWYETSLAAVQASLGLAGLTFILFTCSSILFGVNVVTPIRRAFGVRLEGTDATAQLQRGSNLAISHVATTQNDIEALAPETLVAVPECTSHAAVEPVAVEPVAVNPTTVETATVVPALPRKSA
ncbi:LANO_0A00254g1_1 [Lachancea nothofagi CBS 11611]|uniref:LANO_0A00254g1_1 n=1 Tax=Lachancea nothofagi CBS 11611 TaxID=1266666 RepID=A0A1G4ILV5_9SACH|nr:LANO_0A00254g1_1 [Lachancea nothofagi CBS 11611]